jgi:hypothetical protein
MKQALVILLVVFLVSLKSQAQPLVLFHEEFDGGIPSSWQITTGNPTGASWQWSPTGKADSVFYDGAFLPALFWGNRPAIASPSVANGAAMFNSDAYDSAGIGIGEGPFPENQHSSLISPEIDCSNAAKVYLKFNQYARAFLNEPSTLVSVSPDGGENWEYFPINNQITENRSTGEGNIVIVDISSVAAEADAVMIRFSWQGRYHFWLIDDVQLITPPEQEIQITGAWYPPSSFSQPAFQVAADTFLFAALHSNLGDSITDTLSFRVRLLRQIGAQEEVVFEDSITFRLPPHAKDSLIAIPDLYLPDLPAGEYRILYSVTPLSGTDFNPTDNTLSLPFRISNVQFAKENDIDLGLRPLAGGDYEVGNLFQLGSGNYDPVRVVEAVFSAARDSSDGALEGASTTLSLYRVDETVDEEFTNFDLNDYQQLELLGFSQFTFPSGSQNFELFSTPLAPVGSSEIFLEADERYLLTASYTGSNNDIFHSFNDDIEYGRISTIVYRNGWFLAGFGSNQAAVLRLIVNNEVASSTGEVAVSKEVTIFPNPASHYINLEIPEFSAPTHLILTNDKGQLIQMFPLNEAQAGSVLNYPVEGLPSGIYIVQIISRNGIQAGKFIKQ